MTLFFVPFFIISRVSEPKNMWQVLAVIGSQCVSGAFFFFVFVFLIKAVLKHDILSCGWMDRIDLFQTFKRVKYNWSVWTFAKQNFWHVHMHLALNMDAFFVSFYIWYLLYNYLVCVCLSAVCKSCCLLWTDEVLSFFLKHLAQFKVPTESGVLLICTRAH